MKINLLLLFGVFLVFASCSSGGSPSLTEAERDQISKDVDQLAEQMVDGVRSIDLENAFAIYDKEDFQAFNQGNLFSSAQAMKEAYSSAFENMKTWKIEWKSKDIRVLGPESVLLQGVTQVTSNFKDGWVNHFPSGYLTMLFQKKGGEWKATRFHQSWEGPVFPRGTYAVTLTAEDTGDPVKGVADWAVSFDDQYQFVIHRNEEKAVEGSYQIMGNIIRFYNETGEYACTGTPESYYLFSTSDKGLTLEPLRDECEGRRLVYGTHPLQLK